MQKNITLSADPDLIHAAREKAHRERTTLNAQFRLWLNRYVTTDAKVAAYEDLMDTLAYAQPGRNFSRDEMNER
ncbi:MAG: hypothetical protein JEZ11_05655 [Desulfobacterales bacterium]|nr:hypothetical protein [Desulfobacterales bacterium]